MLANMGHGSSIPRGTPGLKIACKELQEDYRKLSGDESFRLAFVKFIKSGEWLEELAVLVPQCHSLIYKASSGRYATAKDAILTYEMSEDKMCEIKATVACTSLKSMTRSKSRPVTPINAENPKPKLESYVNIDFCPCFNGEQYMAILFHILYPIYIVSPQYQRFLKHGIEHGRPPVEDDTCSVLSDSVSDDDEVTYIPCPHSQRLQDILLGCAAYFDESLVEKRLMEPEWLGDVTAALGNHFLAISVVDVIRDCNKFLYTNKAFQSMAELSATDARNASLSLLNGPDTEASQLLMLREAMQPMQTAKFAITYYTKSKRAFTDLVAVKTSAHYSVMVHFPVEKGANLDDLKDVDDLLILVAELLQRSAHTVDATLLAHQQRQQHASPVLA